MLTNLAPPLFFSLQKDNEISACSEELAEISCWTPSTVLYAHWSIKQKDVAEAISEYLTLGMHHSTKEAQAEIRNIINHG